MGKETFLTREDDRLISTSVDRVRRMRMAVLQVSNQTLSGSEREKKEQEILAESEDLSRLIAHLLISYIAGIAHVETREFLSARLNESAEVYRKFNPYSAVGTTADSNRLVEDARTLEAEGLDTLLCFRYSEKNLIPLKSIADLSNNLGLIAPLSMDFLRSTFHREFITQQLGLDCFDLKPAAAHITTGTVVLPQTEDGARVFNAKSAIGIFVDLMSTGDTVRTVDAAVRAAYPEKIVYSAALLMSGLQLPKVEKI